MDNKNVLMGVAVGAGVILIGGGMWYMMNKQNAQKDEEVPVQTPPTQTSVNVLPVVVPSRHVNRWRNRNLFESNWRYRPRAFRWYSPRRSFAHI